VVGNKLDLTTAADQFAVLRQAVLEDEGEDTPVFGISAFTGEGMKELIPFLFNKVNEIARESTEVETEKVIRVEEAAWKPLTIEVIDGVYRVSGTEVEKMAAKTDFENEEALRRFQNFTRFIGLEKELKKKGIKEGDTVRVGSEEFYYYE